MDQSVSGSSKILRAFLGCYFGYSLKNACSYTIALVFTTIVYDYVISYIAYVLINKKYHIHLALIRKNMLYKVQSTNLWRIKLTIYSTFLLDANYHAYFNESLRFYHLPARSADSVRAGRLHVCVAVPLARRCVRMSRHGASQMTCFRSNLNSRVLPKNAIIMAHCQYNGLVDERLAFCLYLW